MPPKFAITATANEQYPAAEKLAHELNCPLVSHPESGAAADYDYLLVYTPAYLGLHKTSEKYLSPFYIDFLSGKLLYRSAQAGLKKELLARALGMHPRENPRIIDATAGLGRDSFILASLGFHITLLERSSILYALLSDAIARAQQHPQTAAIVQRMQLIQANSIEWLPEHPHADIIYLDPMFPSRKKSASVKKEMVVLQNLLGRDMDCNQLFNLALACAARRVVVKRPRLAETISSSIKPNFSLLGKSSRFDCYLP
jgi:16S rRNA (guanine1516-N2)-methyltransferase